MNWISVKDRLPEKDKKVLIYHPSEACDQIWTAWLKQEEDRIYFDLPCINCCHAGEKDGYDLDMVSHWCVFPENPQEQESGSVRPIVPSKREECSAKSCIHITGENTDLCFPENEEKCNCRKVPFQ